MVASALGRNRFLKSSLVAGAGWGCWWPVVTLAVRWRVCGRCGPCACLGLVWCLWRGFLVVGIVAFLCPRCCCSCVCLVSGCRPGLVGWSRCWCLAACSAPAVSAASLVRVVFGPLLFGFSLYNVLGFRSGSFWGGRRISPTTICLMRRLRLHGQSLEKSKCRRAASSNKRPNLTRETNCAHNIRAFSSIRRL